MEGEVMAKRRQATKANWADLAAITLASAAEFCSGLAQLMVIHSMAIDNQRIDKQERRDFALAAGYEIERITEVP
jgi:hypothetical protein